MQPSLSCSLRNLGEIWVSPISWCLLGPSQSGFPGELSQCLPGHTCHVPHLPASSPHVSGQQVTLNGSDETPLQLRVHIPLPSLSREPSFPRHFCCKSGKRWCPCKPEGLASKRSAQTVVIDWPGSFFKKQNLRPCTDLPGESTTQTVRSLICSGTL